MGRWEQLRQLNPDTLDTTNIEAAFIDVLRLCSDAEQLLTQISARAAAIGVPIEQTTRQHSHRTSRETQQLSQRGQILSEQPDLAHLPASIIDAASRAAASLNTKTERNQFLADAANIGDSCATPEAAARRYAKLADTVRQETATERLDAQRAANRASRGIKPDTGMHWIYGEFDPETGARVFAAWDAATNRRAKQTNGNHSPHTKAQALVDMLLQTGDNQPGTELNIIIDANTLAGHTHPGSTHETYEGQPLPPEVIDRLGCVANLAATLINEHGQALDHGRKRRLPSRAQRHALRATYNGCGWPHCDTPWSDTEIHHAIYWGDGGPTNLDNLIPLCRKHHHDIHARQWALHLHPDRSITLTNPQGQRTDHPPPDKPPGPPVRPRAASRVKQLSVSQS